MAVGSHPKDASGLALDTKIVNLTAALAAAGNGPSKVRITDDLDAAQREAVNHYMNIGRIKASVVLSTLA